MNQQHKHDLDVFFDYRLIGLGWARADLRVGARHLCMRVSYLSDGLGNLVRAAIAIAEGAPDQTVTWVEEPGCHELTIARRAGTATIQIWHYEDVAPGREDQMGELRLYERCSVDDFCEAISSGTCDVLTRYGASGYREQWDANDFPIADAARLARLVGAGAGAH